VSGSEKICNAKLATLVADPQTKVGNIGRVYPDGIFHCSVNAKLIGVKANTLGAYVDTIFNDENHAPVMSRAIRPPGSDSYVVAIHVPVWGPHHEFLGTLGGAVYLNDLEKQYLDSSKLPANSAVVMLDDDGTILLHFKREFIGKNYASPEYQKILTNVPPPGEIIEGVKKGTSGVLRPVLDGVPRITAFEPVHIFPARNWRVSVTVPTASAYASIAPIGVEQLFTNFVLAIAFLVVLVFVVFMYLIMVNVFRPMELIDKAKTEFVSLASHQLRTPLTSIGWYAEMLLAEDAGSINDEQKNYLNEIYKGNQRMVELVNSLLNVSRIDLGTFAIDPEAVNLEMLAQSVAQEQRPQTVAKKITLTLELAQSLPTMNADPKLLRIILQNLLSNAIKYTPDEGNVTLRINSKDKKVFIEVADTGYGVPDDQKDKIFTKLFRADNVREKDTEGTGLGLYLVKAIVEETGGSVWFESEQNKGTTFFVTLPIEMHKKAGAKPIETK
jgi:signal transduction histidine kinase